MTQELYTNDYIKSELIIAKEWMGQKGHSIEQWENVLSQLARMYLYCPDSLKFSCRAMLEEGIRRRMYIFGF